MVFVLEYSNELGFFCDSSIKKRYVVKISLENGRKIKQHCLIDRLMSIRILQ